MTPRVGDFILTRTVPRSTYLTSQSPVTAKKPIYGLAVVTRVYDAVESIGCYFVMRDHVNSRQLIYNDEIVGVIR